MRQHKTMVEASTEIGQAMKELASALFLHLEARRLIARLFNPFFPGYSSCRRCNRNWGICIPHSTPYETNEYGTFGCFALCHPCWQECGIEERIGYYHQLWEDQQETPEKWAKMEQAVREGK